MIGARLSRGGMSRTGATKEWLVILCECVQDGAETRIAGRKAGGDERPARKGFPGALEIQPGPAHEELVYLLFPASLPARNQDCKVTNP
jgi:hypothetical protein